MNNFTQLDTLNKCLIDWNVNYSVYPYNGYTINEVLMQFFDAINNGIITINEYTSVVHALNDWIRKEGLEKEVVKALEDMYENGKLEQIINNKIFIDINNDISRLKPIVLKNEETHDENKKYFETKRLQIIGDDKLPDYPVDIKNFGGKRQDLISFCIHNYSDSEGLRVDNVGEAPCLVLKNAHNHVNRPDKPSNFCGNGLFIKLLKSYFDESGSERTMGIFQMDADTRIHMGNDCHINNVAPADNQTWGFVRKNYHKKPYVNALINGDDIVENTQFGNTVSDYYTKEYQPNIIHKFVSGIARFIHSKKDDGVWGWSFECLNKLKYAFAFKNGEDIAFSVEDEQVNFYYPLRIRPIKQSSIKYGSCLFVDETDNKLKYMTVDGTVKEVKLSE